MELPPWMRPRVYVLPTLDTAIWFLQLRWVAVAGQLLTMAVVTLVLQTALPVWSLLALISVTAVTNLGYAWWLGRLQGRGLQGTERLPSTTVISALMVTDILDLTGMLYLSAGIANPFSLFYFVNIAVAGVIITPVWAWGIWGLTVAGVFLLLMRSQPLEVLSTASGFAAQRGGWTLPKLGFLVSFATCSGVITYFVTILTGELREREHALREAEEARLRNRQLEAMATLAAGAGHELASPLSTIAVVAKELSRRLEKQGASEALLSDVSLIRSELDRCRQILDRMTSTAGDAAGERLQRITMDEFVREVLLGIRDVQRVQIQADDAVAGVTNLLPIQAAAQAVRNVVQNALDASPHDTPVSIQASLAGGSWRLLIIDRGSGMTPEVLQRIGEPFFTTKEPGRGMGLGLYLTQNVMRRLNASLRFASSSGEGTTAEVILPLERD